MLKRLASDHFLVPMNRLDHGIRGAFEEPLIDRVEAVQPRPVAPCVLPPAADKTGLGSARDENPFVLQVFPRWAV
jgi:hypothetical protein